MRAMSTALFFFILNMIALGGPTFAGWLMDVFGNNYNEIESIRYSLTVTTCVFIPSVISFLSFKISS